MDTPRTSDTTDRPSGTRRRGAGVAIVVAVGVILALSMALVAFYSSYVADTNRQRLDAVERQLSDLSSNQQLIASELGSLGAASTTSSATSGKRPVSSSKTATTAVPSLPSQPVAASGQPKLTADQIAQGIRLVLGRVVKSGAETTTGVAISFKPGGYYEGSIAFSVAASHGDVLKGSYYVDGSSTRTIDAHVLSGADVSVYGWNGSAASKASAIHTADLAKVLVGGAGAEDPWKSAWYWLEIGPGMAIVKVMQLPAP